MPIYILEFAVEGTRTFRVVAPTLAKAQKKVRSGSLGNDVFETDHMLGEVKDGILERHWEEPVRKLGIRNK